MAVVKRTNTRVVPANNRAVDVAQRAIQGVTDIHQRRMYNAFRVQGFAGILYSRLRSGERCSCQSAPKRLQTLLDEQGNADAGTINQLLTGAQFGVSNYGSSKELNEQTSKDGLSKFEGTFDVAGTEEYPNEYQETDGDNGGTDFDLEAVMNGFDTSVIGFTEASCAVCFGTGYVGGYQAFNTNRQVITPDRVESNGHIDYQAKPFVGLCTEFHAQITIPRGAIGIDSFQLWDNNRRLPTRFTIDGTVGSYQALMARADGRPHSVVVQVPDRWTHLELQFNLSNEHAYFEFPKLTKSSDLSMLDTTDPFQILLSPNVPHVYTEDIFTDVVYGKHYIVQNSPQWNTRNRQLLGWECQVRVVQPQELYAMLPKRHRAPTKNQTVNMVHDNRRGQRI